MTMDIFDLDLGTAAEDGAPMIVKHPVTGEDMTFTNSVGEEQPIRIYLKGNDSKTFRNRMDFHMRQNGKRKNKDQSLAEIEDQSSDLLASVTTAWEGIFWPNEIGEKEQLACSHANAKMLYKARPWLRRQVDEFVAEAENFLTTNSNN